MRAPRAQTFALFDKDKKGVVIQEEVPTIIRYLGAYPSEKEIIRDLLPEMQPDEPAANGSKAALCCSR